jgi:predicted aconitase
MAIDIEFTDRDRALLQGSQGGAAALAMRILVRSAALMGAERLLDITGAHIDGCLYHGQASLDFAERMVREGGSVVVPTTLNVGSMDLIHPELFRGDDALKANARRLMDAHTALGCEASFTCAPYQLKNRPVLGQQIAWAESNAIVFANSVLGARTNRYGDFIDLCAALTGRAPASGLHLSENRHARLHVEMVDFDALSDARDLAFAALGFVVGERANGLIPAITGLPADTTEDELKALGAAAASSGALAMFHAVSLTPEAATLAIACGGAEPQAVLRVTPQDLLAVRTRLNHAQPGDPLVAVCVGTPHFSLTEFERLLDLLQGDDARFKTDFYVNTSRFILWQLEEDGRADALRRRGVQIVTDTCTYITPILRNTRGLAMTNSGKWAHYAPGNIGVDVAFGSLAECVRSAIRGEVCFDGH